MTIPSSGNTRIDVLVDNQYGWSNQINNPLTIRYRIDMLTWSYDQLPLPNVSADNVSDMFNKNNLIASGFQAWADVANITYSRTTSTPMALFREADNLMVDGDTYAGSAYPWPLANNYLHYDVLYNRSDIQETVEGSNGFQTIFHEIGHVLGLLDVDNVLPGSYTLDSSAMSYTFGESTSISRLPSTPMIYDIAAVQYLYGANTLFRATATDYKTIFDGTKKAWTVWDAGGSDTFDASAFSTTTQGVKLDLRGGVDDKGTAALTDDVVRFSEVGDERIAIALDPASGWTKPIEIEVAKGGHAVNDNHSAFYTKIAA